MIGAPDFDAAKVLARAKEICDQLDDEGWSQIEQSAIYGSNFIAALMMMPGPLRKLHLAAHLAGIQMALKAGK